MPIFPANSIEGAIERKYSVTLCELGLAESEAKESLLRFHNSSKRREAIPRFGDGIIENANEDSETRETIECLRRHGVKDSDIRDWWNMHPFEQACIFGITELIQTAAVMEGLKAGMPMDQAIINAFKRLPRYGDPDEANWGGPAQSQLSQSDRPLPIELFGAVSEFVGRKNAFDRSFPATIEKASSLNAILRIAIASGELWADGVSSSAATYGSLKEDQHNPPPSNGNTPTSDWRNWRAHIEKLRSFGVTLDGNSPVSQEVLICAICEYVWASAGGDRKHRHQCLKTALSEAGFRIEDKDSDSSTVWLRGIGFVMRSNNQFKLVRPSGGSGCAGILATFMLFLAAILLFGRLL